MAICPEFEGGWGRTGVCGVVDPDWGVGFDISCTPSNQQDFKDFHPPGALGYAKPGVVIIGNRRSEFNKGDSEAREVVNNSSCPWLSASADKLRKLKANPQT